MIDSPLRCNSATVNGRNSPTVHGYTIKQNIFDLININYIKKSHSVWIKESHRINEIIPQWMHEIVSQYMTSIVAQRRDAQVDISSI